MVLRREMYPQFLFFGPPQAPLNGIRFLCHDRVDFVNILKKTQVIFQKIAAGVRVKCTFDLSVFLVAPKIAPCST